jgi:hypothetical protein
LNKRLKKKQKETVEDLVNKLIVKLKNEGKHIECLDVADGFGAFRVYIHNLGGKEAVIEIATREWETRVKPTFRSF